MHRPIHRIRWLLPLALAAALWAATQACAGVAGMPKGTLLIDGEPVAARIAGTPAARAQGFQHATEAQIQSEAIYFTWEEPRRPRFHMRNVAAPLAIAWIDPAGVVIGIERMAPGESGYQPTAPVGAALELAPRAAERLGLSPGSRVRLIP